MRAIIELLQKTASDVVERARTEADLAADLKKAPDAVLLRASGLASWPEGVTLSYQEGRDGQMYLDILETEQLNAELSEEYLKLVVGGRDMSTAYFIPRLNCTY